MTATIIEEEDEEDDDDPEGVVIDARLILVVTGPAIPSTKRKRSFGSTPVRE